MAEESGEKSKDLGNRTKSFAVRIVRMYVALPKNNQAIQVIGKQVLRSGTSVGAQYREASRARSRAEFVSKVEAALQELEETRYWFELMIEAGLVPEKRMQGLIDEARELTAMLTSSARTAKQRQAK